MSKLVGGVIVAVVILGLFAAASALVYYGL